MRRSIVVALALFTLMACKTETADPNPGGTAGDTGPVQIFDAGTQLPGCIPGRTSACACTNGLIGAQTCLPDRTFGECVCEAMRMDGGTGGGGGDAGGGGSSGGGEGQPCTSAGTCEQGLECFRMTRESQSDNVVQICIRRCMSDDDCSASTIGNMMCREIRFGADACVSAEVAEGEVAELSLRRGGPMTGCDDELSAGGTHLVGVARYAGSGLWELEDDQSSCLRQCSVDDPDDCTAVAPHCSAPFFNSDEVPGICLAAHLKQGATCSRKNGLQQCSRDRDADGRLVCWDYIGQEDDPAVGQCHQLCSVRDQDCINSADPNQSPRCLDLNISSTNDDLGLCSDECSRHPDSCAGMGSNGMGQNCFYGFLRSSTTANIDNPSVAFCYDIQPPVLGAWTAPSMPFDNCDDNRLSCPDRTYCETNGFRNGRGGCMYGCTTATTATSTRTGCEDGAPYMECSPARGTEFKAGRCAPL